MSRIVHHVWDISLTEFVADLEYFSDVFYSHLPVELQDVQKYPDSHLPGEDYGQKTFLLQRKYKII